MRSKKRFNIITIWTDYEHCRYAYAYAYQGCRLEIVKRRWGSARLTGSSAPPPFPNSSKSQLLQQIEKYSQQNPHLQPECHSQRPIKVLAWRCCWQEVRRKSSSQQAWSCSYSTWCTGVKSYQVTACEVLNNIICIGTSNETVVDCPKTESMSKKTSMISSVMNSKIF